MVRLKADLHTHTADDRFDQPVYSSEMLIDIVAKLNYQVLAIACHSRNVYTPRLAAYAAERGVLLVPATETLLDYKHVLLLNPDAAHEQATTFAELRAARRPEVAVVAPHPYYPAGACLRSSLVKHIDLFDAVEISCMYLKWFNPNRKAQRVAQRFGLPLVGTSDCHVLPYCDTTYTWIEAEDVSVPAVIDAIRAGRVAVETRPPTPRCTVTMGSYYVREYTRYMLGRSKFGAKNT